MALVEFGLFLGVWITIVVTLLDFVPAFTVRGVTLDAAETALERATRYLPNPAITSTAQRADLCNQLVAVARYRLMGVPQTTYAGSAATVGANVTPGCRTVPSAGAGTNPVAMVHILAGGGGSAINDSLIMRPGRWLEVCVAYEWRPSIGILWLLVRAPNNRVTRQINTTFTFRYCGEGQIYAYRSQ